jgi:hypothetical protein
VRNFGGRNGIGNGGGFVRLGNSRGRCGLGFGGDLRLRLGFDRFGNRFRFNGFGGGLRCRSFLWLGRGLGNGRLSQHARPCLDRRSGRLRGLDIRRGCGLLRQNFLLLWDITLGFVTAPSR